MRWLIITDNGKRVKVESDGSQSAAKCALEIFNSQGIYPKKFIVTYKQRVCSPKHWVRKEKIHLSELI